MIRPQRSSSVTERNPQEKDDVKVLVTPYLYSETLGIKAAFHSPSTLNFILTRIKDSQDPDKRKDVVYSIPCECSLIYMGWQLRTRVKEHKKAVYTDDIQMPQNSGTPSHTTQNKNCSITASF